MQTYVLTLDIFHELTSVQKKKCKYKYIDYISYMKQELRHDVDSDHCHRGNACS